MECKVHPERRAIAVLVGVDRMESPEGVWLKGEGLCAECFRKWHNE